MVQTYVGTRTVDDTREAKSKAKVVYMSHCPSVHGFTSMGTITKLIKEDVGMTSQKVKKQGRDERNEKPVRVSSMLEREEGRNITIPISTAADSICVYCMSNIYTYVNHSNRTLSSLVFCYIQLGMLATTIILVSWCMDN